MVHSSMMTILSIVCLSVPLTVQQCLIGNQADELYSVTNYYFRLALDDYFQGPALNFTITNDTTSAFKIVQSQASQKQGTAPNNTIALCSSNLNGDPQVQTNLSNVLAQTESVPQNYTIYSDAISGDISDELLISFGDIVNTIAAPSSGTNFYCNDIDSYNSTDVLVTCYSNTQTTTIQYFYKVSQQSVASYQVSNVSSTGITIQISETIVSVQGANTYIYSIVSGINATNSSLWVSEFQQVQLPDTGASQILPIQTMSAENNDYYTSLQVSSDGTVFLLSYNAGLQIFNPNTNLNKTYPINYGFLVSIYEVQIKPNFYNYLIAVGFNETILATDNMFLTKMQYEAKNILENTNAKLYINPDYIISTSTLGVNTYPSFFNKINAQQLLFAQLNQVTLSAYNRLTNTLVTIQGNNTQIYNFINPYITGEPLSEGFNNLSVQATSTITPTIQCTQNFNMNVITQAFDQILLVYPTTLNQMAFDVVYPLPEILNFNLFFQGPSLAFNQTQTNYKTIQYKSLAFPGTLKNVSYSQNFIRVLDYHQVQVTNPFSYDATLKQSLTQMIYYNNSTLAIYQVDPFIPDEYLILTSTTLALTSDVDVVQFTLGYANNGDLMYGVLFSNGTANVYNFNSTESYEVSPVENIALVQIEIIDDLFYAIVESDEGDEGDEGDESYSYELQTYVISEQLKIQQKISDVYQIAYNFPAFGEILFLNQLNQVQIVKNFNNNLNSLVNITHPANITGYPEIAVTEQGLYLISNNQISFMPSELLFPKTSTQQTIQWITIPLYGFNLISPFIYSTTLKHLYIVVNDATSGNPSLWVYQNSQSILSTLYYSFSLDSLNPEWISTIGLSEYDIITVGYEDEISETQDDILLYPSLYIEISSNLSNSISNLQESIVIQGTSSLSNTFTSFKANITYINYGLIVNSKFGNTPAQYNLNQNALAKIDPRIYFEGNLVQTYVSFPQDQSYNVVYQQPLQNISISIQTGSQAGVMRYVPEYNAAYTFVQFQNFTVYVTPYGFDPLKPNQLINFTSFYQLNYTNSTSNCKLIFIDFYTLNPVSLCYNGVSGNLTFQIKNITEQTNQVTYVAYYFIGYNLNLMRAEYLQTGVVAVFFQNADSDILYDLYTFQFVSTYTYLTMVTPYVTAQVYLLQMVPQISSITTIFSMYNVTLSELIANNELVDGTTYYYGLIYPQSQNANILSGQIFSVVLDANITNFYEGKSYNLTNVNMNQTQTGAPFISNLHTLIPKLSSLASYQTIKLITLLNNPTNEFKFVIVPIVISAQGMSYQLDFIFRNYIQYVKTQFNCFFQGLYNATPTQITAANGQLFTIYQNGTNNSVSEQKNDTMYITNYGQYQNLCKNGEILTTIAILSMAPSATYNIQTFQVLTSQNQISRLLYSDSVVTYLFEATQYLYLWMTPNIDHVSVADTIMNATINVTPFNSLIGAPYENASTTLNFTYNGISLTPFTHEKHWGQFIWGGIMAIIVFGVVGYMCSKSQNRGSDYAQV